MNLIEVNQAVNELLEAVSSPRGLRQVIKRYPFLLETKTLLLLEDSFRQARENSQNSLSFQITEIVIKLQQSVSFIEKKFNSQISLTEKRAEPIIKESSVKWAQLVRQFVGLQKLEYLTEAIAEAEKIGEAEIVTILHAISVGNLENLILLVEPIVEHLQSVARLEEALTLRLIFLLFQAYSAEKFKHFPVEQQKEALQTGIAYCQQAVQVSQMLDDPNCEALFLSVMASGFQDNKQLYQASQLNNEALGIYRKLAKTQPHIYSSDVAMTLNNLGIVQGDLKEFAAAKISYSEALDIYRELTKVTQQAYDYLIAMTLNNLGSVQRQVMELAAAEASYNESLRIRRQLAKTDPQIYNPDLAMTLSNLGNVQFQSKEFAAAQSSFDEALSIKRQLAKTYPQIYNSEVAMTLNSIGTMQRDLREFMAARISYDEALSLRRQLANMHPQIYNSDLASTLNNLGNVQGDLREFAAAQISYNEALGIYRELAKTDPQIYNFEVATTLSNLGTVQIELREFAAAKVSCDEALSIFRELSKTQPQIYNSFIAVSLNNLGNAQTELKEYTLAQISFDEALSIRRELAKMHPQIYNPFVAGTLTNLGYLEIDQSDYESAIEHFEESRKLTENMLEKLIDINRRRTVFQENLDVYQGLLICYVKLGRWNEALEIAEQGKSRSVADLLSLKIIRPKNPDNLPELESLADQYEQAMAKAQQIESRLLALYQNQITIPKPSNDIDSDDLLKYQNEISNSNRNIENAKNLQKENVTVREKILAKIRKYEKGFPPKTELLKQNEIYHLSAETDKTIALFRVTDRGTFVFIVYPDGTLEIPIIIKEEFTNQRLREITRQWLTPYFDFLTYRKMRDFDAFKDGMISILKEIYLELVKDVHDKLKDKDVKDILFVPSSDLAILPLHACCWEENGKLTYLLDDLIISYTTSISVFKRAWELKGQKKDNFLFITNPRNDLKFSDLEVDEIKQTFGITKEDLRHEQATKENVQGEMQNGYSIHHFSCHGSYDRRDLYNSSLVLADGEITLKEIMETSLRNAWLTTLSACETGFVNFEETSDEHYGFPLGFVFAGCPSIWGTLWSVHDDATSKLMKLAYGNIKKGIDKSEALHLAQIELKKDTKYISPYYWAGFQHYGV